jgi:hypothetical protein
MCGIQKNISVVVETIDGIAIRQRKVLLTGAELKAKHQVY